jgi:hypothetical protein
MSCLAVKTRETFLATQFGDDMVLPGSPAQHPDIGWDIGPEPAELGIRQPFPARSPSLLFVCFGGIGV